MAVGPRHSKAYSPRVLIPLDRYNVLETIMAGKGYKAVDLLKNSGTMARTTATKLYLLAKDPEVQAKAKKLAEDGKRMYQAATSPEAKRAYRQTADFIKKARNK